MTRPFVDDAQRRNRLQRRHLLAGAAGVGPATSVVDVADAMVGLHATTASTVHLSVWARGPGIRRETVDAALYAERSVVKQLAMRRTLFVMSRPVLADAVGAVGSRVAASERTNLLRDLRRDDGPVDPEAWIADARTAVLALLDGTELTAAEIRKALPDFDIAIVRDVGKKYGGPSQMLPRLLNHLAAAGEVVRGTNRADWFASRPGWTSMSSWLGESLPAVTAADGLRDLVARWLRSFGPGTETDLVWWLGSTKTAVRAALAALDVVEVDLSSGDVGYLLADDVEPLDPVEPRALLLPGLDPTTMGWKQRAFYLDDSHVRHLFDTNGNGGQTAWWDGRIVGGWVQDGGSGDGAVRIQLLEDVPPEGVRALESKAAELAEWLGDVRLTQGMFASPMMKNPVHRNLPA
ncbi:winged helix DNA-binding domain-containing protein [Gordonia sp. HY002]|uniref:winged helix DNA-binding domain-containing protein n=1 Tax=Gordonia zhenghanii TaxID=2911516 RepID=UPI001EF0D075|nr:winged helix DNA-binding domain-containing protein [Gordonia zhenghanii]MCF8569015.1 winged helix DNA-binding domain-containing protein [Gordonia zhenghanii]MCF8606339.1 winged helix DNA-binding domain-containing protein [Gordonia zhenghanii]